MDKTIATDTPQKQRADSPGVRIPPPLVYIALFLVGWFIQTRFPLPFLPHSVAFILGVVLVFGWVVLAIASIPTMIRGGGTLNTSAPSTGLVTSGIYRVTRNPMYLSLLLLYTGVACLTAVTWAMILFPLAVAFSQVLIMREERYLGRAFGAAYADYKARVRRWI